MSYLAISIGGTKCAVSLWKQDGGDFSLQKKVVIPTLSRPYQPVLSDILAVAKDYNERYEAIGIICGGPLDEKKGLILSPPNLKGWDEVDVVGFFERELGAKATLLNDANAGALAEYRFGAGRGSESAVFLTFGTGFGAGLILDGRLYAGVNGNAGEIGHVRLSDEGGIGYGKKGSVEGFVSGSGMAQTARRVALRYLKETGKSDFAPSESELDGITAKLVAEKAESGSSEAEEVFRITGEALGKTLAIIVDIINPDRIIIGGIYARNEARLAKYAMPVMEKESLKGALSAVRVVPAELGESIDEYAALCAALE